MASRGAIMSMAAALSLVTATAAATIEVDTTSMWAELKSHCAAGLCKNAEGSKMRDIHNSTDCHGRMLAYEYALTLIPARNPQLETFDALNLETTCGVTRPTHLGKAPHAAVPDHGCSPELTFHVHPTSGSDEADGTEVAPFLTIHRALAATRTTPVRTAPAAIVLQAGVHYLNATIEVTATDAGLTITAAKGAEGKAIVSGGIKLAPKWIKSTRPAANSSWNIWVTDVPAHIVEIRGLQTLDPHRRVTRAREPNADTDGSQGAELCNAPGNNRCFHGGVERWHQNTACVGHAKTVYMDLRNCDNHHKLPNGQPCKNDSAMWNTYNTYSNGHGGCCAAWPGDQSPYGKMGNYFCGNSSAGGWVGYNDPRDNNSVGLSAQLPYGFDYDPTDASKQGPWLSTLKNPAGGIMHAFRAQGWFVNMFELDANDPTTGSVAFKTWTDPDGFTHPVGGWQGGRGWQVGNKTQFLDPNSNYLVAGGWMIENVWEALDTMNEWFFDPAEHKLYLIPNATSGAPPASTEYIAVQLETLISINGTKAAPIKDITIQGLVFRDAADITMQPWGVPSGGDWGLYRGGAIFIEGAEGVTIQHNLLTRLDGNGVFVSGYTRNVTIADNEFSWIADNPMASWGYTNENDGTDGQQPRYTDIKRNYAHEWGHYEKQSSFWSNNKACLVNVENNIMFNAPRAGINFNDGFGGGTNVTSNLIFNQCRESGDHGAMNSWDRTAYLSDVKYGTPSYTAQMNNIQNNFIIANYGASQGFDTDDGSSWYNITHNFFFEADAWKMDYGGHDSAVTHNVIYHGDGGDHDGNDGQNCLNIWSFLPEHGVPYNNNKCILPRSTNLFGSLSGCDCPGNAPMLPWHSPADKNPQSECGITFDSNEYFTHNGSAHALRCGDFDTVWKPKNEPSSTVSTLPTDEQLVTWAKEVLLMK